MRYKLIVSLENEFARTNEISQGILNSTRLASSKFVSAALRAFASTGKDRAGSIKSPTKMISSSFGHFRITCRVPRNGSQYLLISNAGPLFE